MGDVPVGLRHLFHVISRKWTIGVEKKIHNPVAHNHVLDAYLALLLWCLYLPPVPMSEDAEVGAVLDIWYDAYLTGDRVARDRVSG